MERIGGIKPYRGEQSYIFVSYAHLDRDRVFPVIRRMIEAGYRVWYDEGIDPGTEWDANIAEHVVGCHSFAAFISNNYLDSDNCKDELNFARDLQKNRLLVYLENVALPMGMAMRLNRLQAIHQYSYSDPEEFFVKLFSVPHFSECRQSLPAPVGADGRPLPRIRVIGVGGAGGNTVMRLKQRNTPGVETIAVNTDAQALATVDAHRKLALRIDVSGMIGRGRDACVAMVRLAAGQQREDIAALLDTTDIAFITCGLGGITGTTVAPIVAQIAREMGILTIGIVSMPFRFESKSRTEMAMMGLEAMQKSADMVAVLYNDKLMAAAPRHVTMQGAFAFADETLCQGVQAISDLALSPGVVRLNMDTLRIALRGRGLGYIGVGAAAGERRVLEAAKQAVANPMLGTSLTDARQVLVNITATSGLTVAEVDEAASLIAAATHKSAAVTLGTAVDDDLGDEARVVVIATELQDPA